MKSDYDFSTAQKGKKVKEVKVSKTFRLDPEVLEWLQTQAQKEGFGYQTYLNWFLRKAMSGQSSLESRLRRVEEELFKKEA